MPRIIRKTVERHPNHEKLLRALVKEFTSPGPGPQPFILEEHAPRAQSRTVYVIWDELADLSPEQRYDLISDAYRQVEGEEAAAQLIAASGLTAEEGVALGLMPYRVVPRRRGNALSEVDYRRAMTEEAAHTILGRWARELRYVRKEDAEDARRRLKATLPGSTWKVEHDEDAED